jgi:hypothetical protein
MTAIVIVFASIGIFAEMRLFGHGHAAALAMNFVWHMFAPPVN